MSKDKPKLRRSPMKKPVDDPGVEKFIKNAEKQIEPVVVEEIERDRLPWEALDRDVQKVFNLRIPESYFLKLKYVSDNLPTKDGGSMQKVVHNILFPALDEAVERIMKGNR